MPAERYFIDEELASSTTVLLKEAEFHHLAHVMRARKGEHIELVNGRGQLAQAVIEDIQKDKAYLSIHEVSSSPPPLQHVILAQAFPKPDRLAFILEKGTELGVDEFWLFPGHLSHKKEIFSHQQERARSLTIAAMKQCGRLTLPSLHIKPPLEEWPSLPGSGFFGDLSPDAPLFADAWKKTLLNSPFLFLTGPESGWSPEEILLLKAKGAIGVKLHPYILRTDTASIVALGLMQHWLYAKDFGHFSS